MNGAATEINYGKRKAHSIAAPQPEAKSPSQIVAGFFYAFFQPFCDVAKRLRQRLSNVRSKKPEARGKIS